ncbi:hypothetical protein ABT56_16115 [Photobacterium aquae]|uniref:Uncharacterized protein n=1 Tax=Photobacterium aquae TaxID=1195763 RepID=A0A0J1GWX4_9GAMM|nr:hypothetical protein ABT56_16115 [Photobacterium aquae]
MKLLGLLFYWIGCIFSIGYLLNMAEWQQFYDSQSIITTFLPTFCAFFIRPSESAAITSTRCMYICWISAGLTTVYGLIRIFGHYPIDLDAVLAGCSVALLPIFYAFIFTLIAFPITIKIKPSA